MNGFFHYRTRFHYMQHAQGRLLIWVYSRLFSESFQILYQVIPGYSESYQVIPRYSRSFRVIQGYSRCYSESFWDIPGHSESFWDIPRYSVLFQMSFRGILRHSKTFRVFQTHSETFRDIPRFTTSRKNALTFVKSKYKTRIFISRPKSAVSKVIQRDTKSISPYLSLIKIILICKRG